MKKIFLMRHADAPNIVGDDFNRILSKSGKAQAENAAKLLSSYNIELILCSNAHRAIETCRFISKLNSKARIEFLDEIYTGSIETIEEAISNAIEPELNEVLVIGHNPTIFSLAIDFCNKDSEDYTNLVMSTMTPARIIKLNYDSKYWPNKLVNNGYLL